MDFMSHTYSRTAALLEEFAQSLTPADAVILHKIYSSAREQYSGNITGKDLYTETAKRHDEVHYFQEIEEALPFFKDFLKPGDLLITMGAGNNWTLGRTLYKEQL